MSDSIDPPAAVPAPAPPSPPRWRRRAWWAAGVVLFAAAVLWWAVPAVLGPQQRAVLVRRHEIVQTVVASGRVESPARIRIGSQLTGRVTAVPVIEGQIVVAGQLLIGLDDADASAALEQARAAVAQAEARVDQLRELLLPVAEQALVEAEANRSNVQQQWTRTQELRTNGFVSQSDLEVADRGLSIANGDHETARLRLQATRPGGADHAIAQSDLRQANASLRLAQAGLDHTAIVAPADGTLIARNVERGDVVQPGQVLMELSPKGKLQLVVQIDEKNLRRLAIGQLALAAADAGPERRFGARLVFVNPGIDASRGSVEVKLDVIDPPDILRQDMTVSVDIEVDRRTDALGLPPAALHDASGKAPYVLLVEGGRVQRRAVQLGARGEAQIEILTGLAADDVVLLAGPTDPAVGHRVRPQVEP
ncbi:MAG: efflux RND transporter periplasmic adaptor subunit [Planctomycetes bacterium]|jgi:HlyD family secretion protein|nr:efflux RND transporter periplasmic adaptor subunit [Planctomycetota bacterium]